MSECETCSRTAVHCDAGPEARTSGERIDCCGSEYCCNGRSSGWTTEPLPSLVAPQPPPTASEHPAVWDLVLADMAARDADGRTKYGTPLRAHNGRDALVDAYQEALDLAVYLRTAIYERDGR